MLVRSASSARIGVLSTLSVLAALAAAVCVVACSAPADAKKPLPTCDANDPTCVHGPASSTDNKAHGDIPTDPVPVPDQTTDDPGSTSSGVLTR